MIPEVTAALIGLGGVIVGAVLGRISARESHKRALREEFTRSVEWAMERAVSDSEAERNLGLGQLELLTRDPRVTPALLERIATALADLNATTVKDLNQIESGTVDSGEKMVAVVEAPPTTPTEEGDR